jgi:hypothetical protein
MHHGGAATRRHGAAGAKLCVCAFVVRDRHRSKVLAVGPARGIIAPLCERPQYQFDITLDVAIAVL